MTTTNYPGADDNFSVPSEPENIPLSQRGSASLNHTELHAAINAAVIALENNATQLSHDHSGDPADPLKGSKLLQVNTHEGVDTDITTSSIHHTIGPGATQASPGNHIHDYTGPSIINKPMMLCTSTTRPTDPAPGMMIWETDTNCVRAWASFPNNTLASGSGWTDYFDRTSLSVAVDAAGPGASANSSTLTWNHTVAVGATALVVAVTNHCVTAPNHLGWTNNVTYNGVAMTQLAVVDNAMGLGGFITVYGLLNPAPGTHTVAVGMSKSSNTPYLTGSSVSYFNVGSFGTPALSTWIAWINPPIKVKSSPGNMVFAAFGGRQGALSAPSGTLRFNSFPSSSYNSLLIQDAPGELETSMSCHSVAADNAGIAISLITGAGANLGTGYAQSYVSGASPANGVMATPTLGEASWVKGANETCRCIARNIDADHKTTVTTNQQFDFVTGAKLLDPGLLQPTSPTNDIYLRMSADGNTYVRLRLDDMEATILYTTSGPGGEKVLGSGSAGVIGEGINWSIKANGRTYILYRNGIQLLTVVDAKNATTISDDCRGWGIGMTAVKGVQGSQLTPASITSLKVADLPYYTTEMTWQLLPIGTVPIVRAECHVSQQVAPATQFVAFFDTLYEDWFGFVTGHPVKTKTTVAPATDIVVTESGHYDVHASLPWHPDFFGFDHAMIGVTVNGQDIGRRNWQFVRGNGFAPGFAQTQEISFSWRFAAGDILRVICQHNARSVAELYYDLNAPNKQVVHLDLKFTSP